MTDYLDYPDRRLTLKPETDQENGSVERNGGQHAGLIAESAAGMNDGRDGQTAGQRDMRGGMQNGGSWDEQRDWENDGWRDGQPGGQWNGQSGQRNGRSGKGKGGMRDGKRGREHRGRMDEHGDAQRGGTTDGGIGGESMSGSRDGQDGGYNAGQRSGSRKGQSGGQEDGLSDGDVIPRNLDEIRERLVPLMGYEESFDVLFREMIYGDKRVGILFLNGMTRDDVMTEVIKRLTYLNEEQLEPDALKNFLERYVAHSQVVPKQRMTEVIDMVLAGNTALFIDGENQALIIDAKMFPQRSPEEPSTEKVVRGAKDGFVETLVTNIALVRRRIRDPKLRMEIVTVSERTKTDVCIGYIKDIANPTFVESIRDKIKQLKVDGVPLADKQLEEGIVGKGWNPFPLVRYTERPDVLASHLLEGNVCVMVDTSPSVMIIPTTFFDHMQHAEEYRQTPFVGTYLRWVRFLGIFVSLFLLPLWFLFVQRPDLLPEGLKFIGPEKTGELPLLLQFILAEVGVDLMRMAAVHTPTPIATAMGLVAAVLIGDIAVKTGLFINEVILYMAIAALGMFATPSYELGLANRMVRLVLLIAVGLFHVPGFVVGTTLILLLLITQRSYGIPYFWPFTPFNLDGMIMTLFRRPFLSEKTRPSITKPLQYYRMPKN